MAKDEPSYWERVAARRWSRRTVFKGTGIAGAGLAAAAVLGCGDDDDDDASDTGGGTTDGGGSGASTPAPSGGTATPAPKKGGTLQLATGPFVAVLDPHTATQPNVLNIWHAISHHLVELDEQLQPTNLGAAQAWEQADATTLVFKLYQGMKFHDVNPANGREFTADDVKYSLDRIRTPEARYARRTQFEQVDQVTAVDKYTVRITLKKPYAPILMYLGSMYNMMICREAVEKFGDLERPESNIGIGPFMLKEYNKESHASLKKNPNYFRAGLPYLDGVEITSFADAAASNAALRAGQLHYLDTSQQYVKELMDASPNLKQAKTVLGGLLYEFGMNQQHFQPFRDLRVRKAIHLVIDRDAMVANKWGARENGLMAAPAPPSLDPFGLTEKELYELPGYRKPKDQDIAEAKRLMQAAGFADGFKVKAKTAQQYLPDIEPVIPWLKDHLKIQVELNNMEWGAYKKAESTGDTEAFGTGYLVEPEPDAVFRLLHHSKGSRNYVGFSDVKADDLIEKQAGEYDVNKRALLTKELGRYLIDQVPHGWHGGAFFGYRLIMPKVQGVVTPKASYFDRLDQARVWLA